MDGSAEMQATLVNPVIPRPDRGIQYTGKTAGASGYRGQSRGMTG